MTKKGALKCGNENECCCCCKLSIGIKVIGGWLIFELLLQLLMISTEGSGLAAITNVVLFILALVSVIMFIWSMCKVEDVRPRDYWLKAFMAEFIIALVFNLILLAYMNLSDALRDKCVEEIEAYGYQVLDDGSVEPIPDTIVPARVFMYKNVSDCVQVEKIAYNIFGGIFIVIFLVLRIYLAC